MHGTLVVGGSQTAALNRGRHLYSAGWPSSWASAHVSISYCFYRTSSGDTRGIIYAVRVHYWRFNSLQVMVLRRHCRLDFGLPPTTLHITLETNFKVT